MRYHDPISITPAEYELAVKKILDAAGVGLPSYESAHLEQIHGTDGDYVFDVTVRFTALGAHFLVLVECKHQTRNVERHEVQVLKDKLQSIGAQKGLLFSTSGFQSGALEYAEAHGISLVQFADGKTSWFTKSEGPATPPPPWARIPRFVGWWHHGSSVSLLSEDHPEYTRVAIGVPTPEP